MKSSPVHGGAAGMPPPLWRQLQVAAAVVASVRQGESATSALARVNPALRPGVQALVFRVLRQLGRAEALRKQLARRAPPPALDALLCTALALCWRPDDAPYDAHTLVDQAVEAAKRDAASRGQSGFLNGCLRRFLREREALVAATEADPAARWNHPSWWIARLQQDHPAQWQQILEANNRQPPLSLRVNARRAQRAELQQRLADAGLPSQPAGDQGLVLARPRPVDEIPGFAEGLLSVQDLGAQMAAPLLLEGLDLQAPLRILDACAAPGGKTAHLLESAAHAQVTALDIDPVRCERIQDNLRRLGLQAQVLAADAARPQDWWDGRLFDAILLDAPCTASGIVRRHPDVRWLRRPSDLDQLAAQQARLLDALWPLLQPGGRLLYCTCSVFRAEGEARMQTFVTHNKDASQRPAPGHLIPQIGAKPDGVPDNPEGDHDGFYYGLLEKKQVADGRNQGASREGGVA